MCCRKFSGLQSRNKREDHSSFSKSGIRFILFKQTKSQLSQFFLPFFQSHASILIQCNADCKEHLYHSQPEHFARQQNQQDVCFLTDFKYSFSTITKPIKAWMVSHESLKTYLLNHINRKYKTECSCFTTRVGNMSGIINILVCVTKS